MTKPSFNAAQFWCSLYIKVLIKANMLLNPVRHDKNIKHLRVLPKMLVIECAYLHST